MDADILANCTCFNLRKAMRVVTKVFDEALKPSGLRATQFSLLATVDDKKVIGITELAAVMVTDRTTLTRNLKPLLKQNLVEVIEGDDQRQRPIAVTSKGKTAIALALPLWRVAQSQMVENLGQVRWEGLLGDLNETVSKVNEG